MRISMRYIVLGAAFMATPALAQLGLGGQAGAGLGAGLGVGVNAGGTVGGVMNGATGTLDRTVNATDRTVNGALDRDLTLATSADLASGAVVRDRRGGNLGVVQSVSGNTAVVVKNGRALNVPLASLYRGGSGLVTNLSKSQLNAAASANANANASGEVRR